MLSTYSATGCVVVTDPIVNPLFEDTCLRRASAECTTQVTLIVEVATTRLPDPDGSTCSAAQQI